MFKRVRSLIVTILVIALLVSVLALPVQAASEQYRIVLRYYDQIQITYTITYPASSGGGVREGPEDVPIGGVGTPGAGDYDINPYISTQIYCVDPYVPFHSKVPGLGGIQSGPGNNYQGDVIYGYISAVPWEMSGAMAVYGDAVRWIAANGYRGIYNYNGVDDAEDRKSVV